MFDHLLSHKLLNGSSRSFGDFVCVFSVVIVYFFCSLLFVCCLVCLCGLVPISVCSWLVFVFLFVRFASLGVCGFLGVFFLFRRVYCRSPF